MDFLSKTQEIRFAQQFYMVSDKAMRSKVWFYFKRRDFLTEGVDVARQLYCIENFGFL